MQELQRNDDISVGVNAKNSCIMWQSAAMLTKGRGSTTIGEVRVQAKPSGNTGDAAKHRDMVFSALKNAAACGIIYGFDNQLKREETRMNDEIELIKSRLEGKYRVDEESGCWVWTKSTAGKGYGQLRIRALGKYGPYAHRLSYIAHVGPIPKGLLVCHKCDNPRCINPEHLFLGTSEQNLQDMKSKDRHLCGARNTESKLSEEQVQLIYELKDRGVSSHLVGKIFKIGQMTAWRIMHGVRWEHLFIKKYGKDSIHKRQTVSDSL